jgi:hypothetical protein
MLNPNTKEWELERMGKFTGSAMGRLMAYPNKAAMPKGGETYVRECVAEELSGLREGFGGSAITDHGHTYEPYALQTYSVDTGIKVNPGVLVIIDEHSGFTPDGMTGGMIGPDNKILETCEGIQEVKCPPKNSNHIEYLLLKSGSDLMKKSSAYYYQCHFNMYGTGAGWCDFITYSPYYNGILQCDYLRIPADLEVQEQMKSRLKLAIKMKLEMIDKLLKGKHREARHNPKS